MATTIFHQDHNVSQAHVAFAVSQVPSELNGFFLFTWTLPLDLSDLQSGLHGPDCGDAPVADAEVEMVRRGERPNLSRLCSRPMRPTRLLTAVGTRDAASGDVTFYTLYGGLAAPREIGDESLVGDEPATAESSAFWATHALSR